MPTVVLIAWAGAIAIIVYVVSLLSRLVKAVEKILEILEKPNIDLDKEINFNKRNIEN
jgi:hypothetical protein